MDTERLSAAIIRAFWTVVMPIIGALVNWLLTGTNLQEVGIESAPLILAVSAVLYGVKKWLFPDTRF